MIRFSVFSILLIEYIIFAVTAIGQMAFVLAFMLTRQERMLIVLPTHRCTLLVWNVSLDFVPLDIAGYGIFLYMVVHETTDVRESIDTLSAKLAMAKKSMLMPRPKGAVTYVENTFYFFSSKELLFGFVFLTLLSSSLA